jgi:hypothetical protein
MPYGAGDLKLEIDYQNENLGWIHCHLTFNGVRRHLYASNVFSPFPELLIFLRAIHTQRLPHDFLWDEEGRGAKFEALPAAADDRRFHLRIAYEFGSGETWVDAELDRQAVIDVFSAPLSAFVRHASPAVQEEWGCTAATMESFYHLLSQPVAPRSRAVGLQDYFIAITAAGGDHLPIPLPLEFFQLNVYGIPKFILPLNDRQIFWPYWFSWMEKIILGKLPAKFKFQIQDLTFDMPEDEAGLAPEQPVPDPGDVAPDEDEFFQYFTVIASPVEDACLFHLSITYTNPSAADAPMIDETFDRHGFASAFCEEFERFLRDEYKFYGPPYSSFDLNNLPIDRLKSLL